MSEPKYTAEDAAKWPDSFLQPMAKLGRIADAEGVDAVFAPQHIPLLEACHECAPDERMRAMLEGMIRQSRFAAVRQRMAKIAAEEGSDALASDENWPIFAEAMRYAPREYLDAANEVVEEMGLLPSPVGVNERGEATYSAADLAEKLGITEADVLERMHEIDTMGMQAPQKTTALN